MALNEWTSDLRQAARTLRRTPGFAVTAVGMLGLAIGATAGMFSVVDAVLLDPLPFEQPGRLVHIGASAPGSDLGEAFGVSAEFYVQYSEQSRLLEDVATYNSFTATLRAGERVERVRMSVPTNSLFPTLGVQPILGRLPVSEDENNTVLISHALWTTWFNRDPGVIGRSFEVASGPRTVIGVMGPEFRFPAGAELWIANTIDAADIDRTGNFGMSLVGRMAPGATTDAVATELTALAARLPERFGGTPAYTRIISQHRALVQPLKDQLLGPAARPLWVLLGAAGIVLLIACANVSNLFMVRAEARNRELAVRRTLGASRPQLARLQFAEALLVGLLAGALGLLLAALVLPLFLQLAPAGMPRLDEVRLTATTLLFTAATALLSALGCGGLPALRGSAPDLSRLRDGGRALTSRRRWTRDALVAAQTALALVLLIGSGLLLRSAWELHQVDPGYDTDDVFTFQIAPEREQLQDAASFARFNLAFLERLAALPGVASAGLVENVPLQESTSSMRVRTETMRAGPGEGALLNYTYSAGDYFATMRIPLLAGRTFADADHSSTLGNVVLSQSAAQQLWPGRDPIGMRLQREGSDAWETVVGVVGDVLQDGLQDTAQAVVYFPLVGPMAGGGQPLRSPGYVVRSERADSIAADVRALAREVAPEAPMYRAFTMEALVNASMLPLRFTLLTLSMAALLALVLGAVGLYGVLSYIVAERTREIGVRMALGARAPQVRGMVVAEGARVLGAGVVVGLLAALASTRALDSLLHGVQPIDPPTFAAMALAMLAVGLLASYLPARRASNLTPTESMRRD